MAYPYQLVFCGYKCSFPGNFILQFLITSCAFGIPLLWLYASIGVYMRNGPIGMWRISPVCKGIGLAAVLISMIVAIYSSVTIGWLLVILKDVLVTGSFPNSTAGNPEEFISFQVWCLYLVDFNLAINYFNSILDDIKSNNRLDYCVFAVLDTKVQRPDGRSADIRIDWNFLHMHQAVDVCEWV